jgi:hypothetical protein
MYEQSSRWIRRIVSDVVAETFADSRFQSSDFAAGNQGDFQGFAISSGTVTGSIDAVAATLPGYEQTNGLVRITGTGTATTGGYIGATSGTPSNRYVGNGSFFRTIMALRNGALRQGRWGFVNSFGTTSNLQGYTFQLTPIGLYACTQGFINAPIVIPAGFLIFDIWLSPDGPLYTVRNLDGSIVYESLFSAYTNGSNLAPGLALMGSDAGTVAYVDFIGAGPSRPKWATIGGV